MPTAIPSKIINKVKLSSDILKAIACLLMFIDHFAFGVIYQYLMNNMMSIDPETYTKINKCYDIMRNFGRMAFPIYAFLLVEGFFHTRSVLKYALRLAVTAAITEVIFDLALYRQSFYKDHQSVMVTLLISLLAIWGIDYVNKIMGLSVYLKAILILCISAAAMQIGQITLCDYKWHGVLSVILIYLLHEMRPAALLVGAASFSWEKFAPISFFILYFYDENKKPNPALKYVFYLFYPVHLLIIYLIGRGLGL